MGLTPNPVCRRADINFILDRPGQVVIEVFDVAGRSIREVLDSHLEPGHHRIEWDGHDDRGQTPPAGTYFARVSVDGRTSATRTAVVLR